LRRLLHSHLGRLLLLAGALAPTLTAQADAVSAVQVLRAGGCGGILPAARPLTHNALLDRAAELWAAGGSPASAAAHSGYEARATAAVHVRGRDSATLQLLRQSDCRALTDQGLHDIGVYHRGLDTWLVLASASGVSGGAPAPLPATRALQLVNDARSRGVRCGGRSFGPAPPLRLSGTLAGVAFGHAADMAAHEYFEHEDLSGRPPAQRVRAVGYPEKLVGENIAYGPQSSEEVVQGWLDSSGHCENIMDSRFTEMGIAYAAGHGSRRALYWVQLLAVPRS
jgi:uncharacterized protein YkwD